MSNKSMSEVERYLFNDLKQFRCMKCVKLTECMNNMVYMQALKIFKHVSNLYTSDTKELAKRTLIVALDMLENDNFCEDYAPRKPKTT
jgi:hypothetical protein